MRRVLMAPDTSRVRMLWLQSSKDEDGLQCGGGQRASEGMRYSDAVDLPSWALYGIEAVLQSNPRSCCIVGLVEVAEQALLWCERLEPSHQPYRSHKLIFYSEDSVLFSRCWRDLGMLLSAVLQQ